jgi:thiol-disulfide isomerase/thioredoxin
MSRSATTIFLIALTVGCVFGQSGRSTVGTNGTSAAPGNDLTVKQMFDEVNGYAKAKFNEFAEKKIKYSDSLLERTKLEQRQLAARYAAEAGTKKGLAGDDLYYLGMLHWIAVNLDGTIEGLQKFVAADNAPAERRQTARSILVVALAKQRKLTDAETILSAYIAAEPVKLTERARMELELAKAYQAQKDFARMAPHAEAGYKASKGLLQDAALKSRGMDEIFDAGMLVFEAYRDSGDQKKAIAALDEVKAVAASTQSPNLYYYAVDQKIKYLIDVSRKGDAMDQYVKALAETPKDLPDRAAQSNVLQRLKKRDRHYNLLGTHAPELPAVDQWFPGERKTIADLKGKVVLLDFWATWCAPCFEAFPSLIEWHREFPRSDFEILGITRYEGNVKGVAIDRAGEIEYFKQFRMAQGLPYDFVVADGQGIQLLYGGMALPTAVLIDRKGVIRYIEAGASPTRMAQMREMIVKLLAEK